MSNRKTTIGQDRSARSSAISTTTTDKFSRRRDRPTISYDPEARGSLRLCRLSTEPHASALTVVSNDHLRKWRNLTGQEKALLAQSAIAKGSHAKPFTINLDHDIASKAYKSPKGAVGYVAHRLNRHLTKDGHIFPAWFALEISKSNVLHLHGCIITQTDEDLSVIKAAFRRVSGPFASDPKMVAGRFAVRIAKHDDAKCFQGSFGALGWGRYCLKSVIKTEKAIGCPPISMNHHMTNIARDYWGDIVSDANRTHGNRLSASDHGETSDEFKLAG